MNNEKMGDKEYNRLKLTIKQDIHTLSIQTFTLSAKF